MSYKVRMLFFVAITALSCKAMKIPTTDWIIQSVGFSENDKIAVAGLSGCNIYSTKGILLDSMELSQMSFGVKKEDYIYDMVFSSDRKKMILVRSAGISVYDITKKIKADSHMEFNNRNEHSVIVRPGKLYVYGTYDLNQNRMDSYNYQTGEWRDISKRPELVGESTVDGTLFARANLEKCDFCDTSSQKYLFSLSTNDQNNAAKVHYTKIAFHPNNIIVALLNIDKIEFWNYKNQKLLGTINLLETVSGIEIVDKRELFSFSPDGKQFVVGVNQVSINGQVLLCDTPFYTMYKLFWFLNNYSDVTINKDIKDVLKNSAWKSCFDLHKEKAVEDNNSIGFVYPTVCAVGIIAALIGIAQIY